MIERCIGCDAEVLSIEGPIHRYMTSAPACWHRYGELLACLYALPDAQAALIICADTYAAQHPGTPNPQAIQSVAIHLLNLYNYLERGRPVKIPQETFTGRAFHSIAPPEARAAYWLEPPSFAGTKTVFDMPQTGTGDELKEAAMTWAKSVWMAWQVHHVQIAEWWAKHARA